MKFVIAWTNTRAKTPEDQKALLQAYEAWTPPDGISEFVQRADGQGGGLIIEADDVATLSKSIAPFVPWLDYEIIPVLDIGSAVEIVAANLK